MSANDMWNSVVNYLQSFASLYGEEHMIPKFHYMFHVVARVEKHGWAASCFCLERKHKNVKKYGNALTVIKGEWSTYITREVTADRLAMLRDVDACTWGAEPALLKGRAAPRALHAALYSDFNLPDAQFLVASAARINEFERVHQYDVCLARDPHGNLLVGDVALLLEVQSTAGNNLIAFLRQWRIDRDMPRVYKCQRLDAYLCVRVGDIMGACIWGGTDVRTVMKPLRLMPASSSAAAASAPAPAPAPAP